MGVESMEFKKINVHLIPFMICVVDIFGEFPLLAKVLRFVQISVRSEIVKVCVFNDLFLKRLSSIFKVCCLNQFKDVCFVLKFWKFL